MVSSAPISEHDKLAVTLGTVGPKDHRNILISHGKLQSAMTITFQRTLRVPDNKDVNNLPPSLGIFPLFSVAEYKNRMPEDMAEKGGIFLPMYQKEAMWISFSAKEPFALKIYVGGVNAISGRPINESPDALLKRLKVTDKVKQDYIVLPEQPWLDGIAHEDGNIRQFVAMPKGSGYSVEAQITGEEKFGGLQFEITPAKRGCPEQLTVRFRKPDMHYGISNRDAPATKVVILNLHEKGLGDDSTIEDLKKLIRDELDIALKHQALSFSPETFGMTAVPSLSDTSLSFSEIWIPENSVLDVSDTSPTTAIQEKIKLQSAYFATQLSTSGSLKGSIGAKAKKSAGSSNFSGGVGMAFKPQSSPAHYQMLSNGCAPSMLMDCDMSAPLQIPSISMAPGASFVPPPPPAPTSNMRFRFCTVVDSQSMQKKQEEISRRSSQATAPSIPTPEVKALSLAAGGIIKQSINADLYPASTWSTKSSILFNVQLLNSASFHAVTGRAPPTSPIDAQTYKSYGMPFYDIWNEELSGVSGEFGGVKSVGMLDEEKAKIKAVGAAGEKIGFWEQVAGNGKDVEMGADEKAEFVGEEKVEFPVVMLDLGARKTFKPIAVMEEERKRSL